MLDAAIVAEELGRHVQPGPFIPMNVVARVDSAVHLSVEADATAVRALHDWALEHIIRRIPGANHGA